MAETYTQVINPNTGENPSLEAQAAAMEKEGKLPDNVDPNQVEDRPPWLPPKFKSAEELAKSYAELEKKLGRGSQANNDEEADDEDEEADADVDDAPSAEEQARQITKSVGLDFDDLSNRYWEEGGLRETDYKALEQKGYPRNIVDQFIAGQQALVAARENDAFALVGGRDEYAAMAEWARENLDKAELNAYNRAVASDDFNTIKVAVKGLKAQYQAAVGYEPKKSVKGERISKSSGDSFASWAQVEAAMNDPRYAKDPAYRRTVEQKLARSPL